jgi:hypothetical protein
MFQAANVIKPVQASANRQQPEDRWLSVVIATSEVSAQELGSSTAQTIRKRGVKNEDTSKSFSGARDTRLEADPPALKCSQALLSTDLWPRPGLVVVEAAFAACQVLCVPSTFRMATTSQAVIPVLIQS